MRHPTRGHDVPNIQTDPGLKTASQTVMFEGRSKEQKGPLQIQSYSSRAVARANLEILSNTDTPKRELGSGASKSGVFTEGPLGPLKAFNEV